MVTAAKYSGGKWVDVAVKLRIPGGEGGFKDMPQSLCRRWAVGMRIRIWGSQRLEDAEAREDADAAASAMADILGLPREALVSVQFS